MADIQGTNNDDIIKGGRGDDLIEGLDGDDRITDVWGDNTINGGAGNDRILASRGVDIVDGGSGSDRIWTRHGDDVATYRLSENLGEHDYYDGGHGTDTLRLVLTAEEARDASVLETIAALQSFVEDADPKSSGQQPTAFTFSIGGVEATLTLRNFEKVEVVVEEPLSSLSIDDPTVTEGDPAGPDATITFTVTRTGDNGEASTVAYTVMPGTAGTPGDYSAIDPLTDTLSFAAGETEKTITLDITDDEIPEGAESFTVELSGATNASITKAVGTGTILDDDLPSLSIDDPTVTEGDPAGPDATITFTVTRTGDNGAASTVAYTVMPGTAGTPGDYSAIDPLTGTLSFAAGETEKTITLDITDDEIPEGAESFTVELSGATNASITKAVGTGTILDDDLPSLSIDDPTVTEGDPAGPDATITFTVTRTGDNGAASTVAYAVVPESATFPEDYNDGLDPLTGSFTFAAGETEKTITLDITDDELPEGTESFTVELSGATNASITKAVGTGTILDDDLPSLSIDDPTVTEGDPAGPDATITFTVTRMGDNGAASTVAYTVMPGTAGTPGDYSAIDPLTGTLSFAAGETEKTITLDITDDEIPEGAESFTVELSGATNASITKAVGTGTILDDDLPSLSIDDPTVTEGDPAGPDATITFTVTRTGDNGAASTVAYAVVPESATFPEDYNDGLDPLTGSFTFAAGETEKTITLDITDDELPEGTESFTVELSGATNASITKAVGTGTILDDDLPSLSIDDPTVTEGDPAGPDATITFTVTRSGDNGAASTVVYTVVAGTSGSPGDYNDSIDLLTDTLTFAAGETEKTITLDITDDEIPEDTESFTVELSAATNAAITKAVGTGTILDDDLPSLSIDDPTVTEGNPGGLDATITFTVTRTGDNGAASTIAYAAMPGSATTPEDYAPPEPLSGILSFAPGEATKTVTLDVTDDLVPETTESFTVELSAPTNATIAKAVGIGTIEDDDFPSLSIDDPTAIEGDPGSLDATITFTVTRTGDNGAESTVAYTALPGSATTPEDYAPPEPLSGILSFAPGEATKTVTLDVTDDLVPETTESFTVELSAPTNATIAKAVGIGTIEDDDFPSLSIDDPTAIEGDPGSLDATITFTVTRTGDNGAASTVAYTALPGSATTPEDYAPPEPLSGILSFAPGEATKTVTLDVTDDLVPETAESFTVELSAPTNATIAKAVGIGTIEDDDFPSLSIDDPTAIEGDPGSLDATITFTVTRTGDNGAASTVAYTALPGSATTPEDYAPPEPLSGILSFAPGEATKTVTLDVTDDLVPETTESFTVELSAPTNATIAKAVGIGTIFDTDEPRPTEFSIDDPSVTEADPGGTTTITFTITRSGDTTTASSVDYAAIAGSATTPNDYGPPEPLNGTRDFAAGETQKTVTLTITNDLVAEDTETFSIELQNPINAVIIKNEGTGTIFDNDPLPPPELSINNPTVTEGDPGETTTITFTITRSGDASTASSVDYVVTPGSATTPEDYGPPEPLTGTKVFDPGQIEQTITLTITNDLVPEDTETFTVTLSNPTNATIGNGEGIGSIVDDDPLDLLIWTSGDNSQALIGIGGALNVGTDISAGTPTDHWTNDSGDRQWSTNGNWEDGITPIATDRVMFDEVDSGGSNFVDRNVAITSLIYTGAGSHITDVINDSTLGISSLVSVGIDNPSYRGSLRVEDVTVNASVNAINIGRKSFGGDTPVIGQLTLTNAAQLNVETTLGDIFIGYNQTNANITSGELNALASGATVNLDVDDLVVGKARGTGTAEGTLRWNQTEAIQANEVYFGWGSNAVSVLDVPMGGTFRLGTDVDRVGNLWLAYNDTAAAGSLSSALDFTVTNPTFEAYLSNSLILADKTVGAAGDTDATLTLGSNSTLDMLSSVGDVILGRNSSNSGAVSGELNALASGATVNLDVDDLVVGKARGTGTAEGTLRWNQTEAIQANEVYFGWGSNAVSVLDVPMGGTFRLGTDVDRVGNLWLAYNDTAAAGSLSSALDFTVTNPTFEAYLSNSLILADKTVGAAGDTDATLTLGSNSTLDMLSSVGDVILGRNSSNSGAVSGELNALASGATVNLDVDDLVVGKARGTGTAEGTLRWNQTEAIQANEVYFGWGSNAVSVLDVPMGGTFRLGTDVDRVGNLWLAYNDTAAAGSLSSALDFTVTNPTFEAYLSNSLILADKTVGAAGDTDATLTLGSNSTLDMLSSVGDVILGRNSSNSGAVSGELNALASGATVNLDVDDLVVGKARGTGTAEGTLRWNQTEAIQANEVYFGWGSNAVSVLDVPMGGTFRLGTDVDRVGNLWLAYNDTAAAGSLSSALDFTVTNPTFEAYLSNSLILADKTVGAAGDTDATLTLGSNSTLDMLSSVGDVILGRNSSNSGAVSGELNALASGATVNLDVDDLVVGKARGTGTAEGTLRWNQTEAIQANEVYFGWGSNAVSVLDVPMGGTFRLGTDVDRVGNLWLAYNDTAAAGSLSSALDFTVTNPTFEAYLSNSLILADKTVGAAGDTDATLTLGSNSTLDMLSSVGDVILGRNSSNSGAVSGELNALASGATVNLDVDDLVVGKARGTGTAEGTLRWNQTEAIQANEVYFGWGSNAVSVLDVPMGGTFRLGTDVDRVGNLWLAYNDTAAAGSLSSALDFTVTNPTFEAYLSNSLILADKTVGAAGDTDATLTLGSNSTLDMLSSVGDVILGRNSSNSGAVSGELNALASGATVNLDVDDLVVGKARGTGTAEGTLRWNQTEAIQANEVYFGWGSNAVSVLDVPMGGTFRLGTDVDRVGNLWLAYNDTAAAGSLSSALDFTVTNPTFEAYLSNSLILADKTVGAAGDTDATLTLGSNSTLDMLSSVGDVILGRNSSNSGAVSGELNALASGATVNLDVDDLVVGKARGTGTAEGTLRWNQTEAIQANEVYFGWGSNAVSVLDVPMGGTFRLGTDVDRVGNLWLAYNDTAAAGSLSSALDFTVTNPTFEAYLSNSLILADKTVGAAGDTDATLTLGSNSTLDMLSSVGDVILGRNSSNSGAVSGELDVTRGTFSANIDQFNVGVSAGSGIAVGTFTMGDSLSSADQVDITANQVNIGSGSAATGTFDMRDGSLIVNTMTLGANGNFLFTGGRLEVTTFNGTLDHDGGTFAPKGVPGISTINGDYNLATAGTLEIQIEGVGAPGAAYDQLDVNGLVSLDAGSSGTGGTLEVLLDLTPTVGSTFVIIDNDDVDAISGTFDGLSQLDTFNVTNGADTVIFQIDYAGGDGNDVVLEVIPLPPAPVAPIAASNSAATGTQGTPATLGASPLVELVPDEDVLVFDNDSSGSSPTAASATVGSLAPATLDLIAGSGRIGTDGVKGDEVDTVVDSGVLDDMDLIGLPSDGGLSHDLYV